MAFQHLTLFTGYGKLSRKHQLCRGGSVTVELHDDADELVWKIVRKGKTLEFTITFSSDAYDVEFANNPDELAELELSVEEITGRPITYWLEGIWAENDRVIPGEGNRVGIENR